MDYFFFHINKFEKGFSSLRLFHDNIGSIWNNKDEIPSTYLKISKFEKEKANRLLISRGVKIILLLLFQAQHGIRSSGPAKIILVL